LRLRELSFILTEDCNFRCAYCLQARGARRLEEAEAARAVRFFRPFLAPEAAVCFYGGEPLLAFSVLKGIVERMDGSRRPGPGEFQYAMTTNGSLLTTEILRFLERRRFSIILSFDGLAQDILRRPGSHGTMVVLIREILARPPLRLEVNSVFTSRTVGLLQRSVEEVLSLGVRTVHLSFPARPSWDARSLDVLKNELAALRRANLSFFRRRGDIPVSELRGRHAAGGLFSCFAGRDRLAVSPDGTVWGCPQIFDYSRRTGDRRAARFAFGEVASLAADPGRLERRLAGPARTIDQTDLSTPESACLFCPDLGECAICPWSAALESGDLGRVAGDACHIARLLRCEGRALQEACDGISRPSPRGGAGRPRPRAGRGPRPSRGRGIFDKTPVPI
jgi:MoaA/NifB/PqqE/SkfB family radical SAM enzyme